MSDARGARPWLYGCGIGCGVLVLLVAVLFGGSWFYLRRMASGFDEASAAQTALDERFGRPDGFTPPPDGAVPPARLEAFLAVRDAMAPARAKLEATFARLPLGPHRPGEYENMPLLKRLMFGFSVGRAALGLAPGISEFMNARNQAMLAQGIGTGEYEYIYTIAYYAWLGHQPAEGPADRPSPAAGPGEGTSPGGQRSLHAMGSSVRDRVHEECARMLRSQLDSLPATAPAPWREALAKEVRAMEADDARMPWQGGVPPAIAASLEPYRQRLQASWNPATNPLEMARGRKRGSMTFSAD